MDEKRSVSAGRTAIPKDAPSVSVVLTSAGGVRTLGRRLAELAPACDEADVDLVAVWAGPEGDDAELARVHPSVRFVRAREGAPAASLRSTGMAEAEGDVVLLAADGDPGTLARLRHLLRCHLPPAGGGPATGRVE